jgi:phosphoserine phosphatase
MGAHRIPHQLFFLCPQFKRRTEELYNKYYPIEIDRSMPDSEKVVHMEDWWRKAHQLIVDVGLNRDDIPSMVKDVGVPQLRAGAKELADACAQRDIPFLVFSAGIASE